MSDDAERIEEERASFGEPMRAPPPADCFLPTAPRRRRSLRKLALGMVLGAVVGIVLAIGIAVWLNSGQPPVLVPALLDAAESRWKSQAIADYDLDLDASLGMQGRMHVEVRAGKVINVTLDGQPTRHHLWDYWTVPGLLGVMRLDRERNVAAANDPAGPRPEPVFQQARFDPLDGVPLEYRRTETATGQFGGWRVARFQSLR